MNRKDFIQKSAGALLFAGISVLGFSQENEKIAKKYKVIEKRCDGCGHCSGSCKEKALTYTPQGKAVIDPKKCKGCGDCLRFCRHMAIEEIAEKVIPLFCYNDIMFNIINLFYDVNIISFNFFRLRNRSDIEIA